MKSKKERAEQKLNEAYSLLKDAGWPERFIDIAERVTEWNELKENKEESIYEILNCSICSGNHYCDVKISRDKNHSWQYTIELEVCNHYSDYTFIDKIKQLFRIAKDLFKNDISSDSVLLKGDDVTKFKDILRRIP